MTSLAAASPLWLGGLAVAQPAALGALVVAVPALVLLLAWSARRRRRDLARFGDPALLAQAEPLPGARRRALRATLAVAAVVLLLVALARPQWGSVAGTARASGADVFLLLDLSRSMNAADVAPVAPSRLDAAKQAAATIARALPDARVGLVVFGGSAFLQLPPTLDHSTVERFLDAASTPDIPDPATSLEAAADLAAAAAAREGDTTGAAVVLLSDGEDVQGKLMTAIDVARRARLRVWTVSFGTPAGAPIPDRDASGGISLHRDWAGRVVISQLHEDNLRDIARLTGGTYVHWAGPESVRPVIDGLTHLTASPRTSRAASELADRFQWLLALALAVLLLDVAAGLPSARRARRGAPSAAAAAAASPVTLAALTLAAALSAAVLGACAGGITAQRARAEERYDQRDFHAAYDAFGALARDAAPRGAEAAAAMEYDAGDAAYRLGRFDVAVRHFRAALAGPPALRARAFYNLGNAYVWLARGESDKRGSLRAAINAYEDAVLLAPNDADAKWNLELAVAKLANEEVRLRGGTRRAANWGGGNLTKSGYQGAPQTGAGATPGGGFGAGGGSEAVPVLTERDARRLLRETERASVTGQDVRQPPSPDQRPVHRKDW